MTRPVFWVGGQVLHDPAPAVCLSEIAPGTEVVLDDEEAHHATVKRLRLGEEVDVVDGQGWRVTAVVTKLDRKVCLRVSQAAIREAPPALRLTLIQALAKEKRDMQALESACEIGVRLVVPWGATRSVSRWDAVPKRAKGREKWRNLAVSAMKQSRQSWVAQIGEYVESGVDITRSDAPSSGEQTVFACVERIIAEGGTVFVLHESATHHLTSWLSDLSPEGLSQAEIGVVVGPEGGITDAELEGFRAAGARVALLGPTVLRCSTAGPAALAVIQAFCGTWK